MPELFEEWHDTMGIAWKILPNLLDSLLSGPEYVRSRFFDIPSLIRGFSSRVSVDGKNAL